MIDLRSDTCSQPTEAMRHAMATAPVGDDVYSDDPTVKRLEREVADLLGKEDAVYMVTGTMTNQVAIRAHTEPGNAVLFDQNAHVYILEGGAPAAYAGGAALATRRARYLQCERCGSGHRRASPVLSRHDSRARSAAMSREYSQHWRRQGVAAGTTQAVCDAGRTRGVKLHLDGARLWHATAATGIPESQYARHFDTVSVCFSKALGAPVGSALAGSREFIARARRFKQQIGGGFRQAGIIAAGALYALQNNRARLIEDHEHARLLAAGIASLSGIEIDVNTVETNIVRFVVTSLPAGEFVEVCTKRACMYCLPAPTACARFRI